eukprot:Opistho-1_new@77609
MATVQQAMQQVAMLDTFQLHDDQPLNEARSLAVNYEASMDPNFDDRNAYIAAMSKFIEEAHAGLSQHGPRERQVLPGPPLLVAKLLARHSSGAKPGPGQQGRAVRAHGGDSRARDSQAARVSRVPGAGH